MAIQSMAEVSSPPALECTPIAEGVVEPNAVVPSSDPAADQRRREWHRAMLMVTAVIIGLSLVLGVRDDQRVVVAGLPGFPMPESCGMRLMFGRDCPGCGLTRSFIHLAHGDWRGSLAVQRVGWILAAAMLIQIPYRLVAIRNPARTISRYWAKVILALFAALLIVNWLFTLFELSA